MREAGCARGLSLLLAIVGPTADIPRYRLLSEQGLVDGARHAVASGARRYCMVTSGRGPSNPDIARLTGATRRIKQEFPRWRYASASGSPARSRRVSSRPPASAG